MGKKPVSKAGKRFFTFICFRRFGRPEKTKSLSSPFSEGVRRGAPHCGRRSSSKLGESLHQRDFEGITLEMARKSLIYGLSGRFSCVRGVTSTRYGVYCAFEPLGGWSRDWCGQIF